MGIGRFLAGVAALVWRADTDEYLLLKRSAHKDYAAGAWECVTGRVDQGEGFEQALLREVHEELGAEAQLEYVLGTTHFYRGPATPENELVGLVCCVSLREPQHIRISAEHSEARWVTLAEANDLLHDADPSTAWLRQVLERAAALGPLVNLEQRAHLRQLGIELD